MTTLKCRTWEVRSGPEGFLQPSTMHKPVVSKSPPQPRVEDVQLSISNIFSVETVAAFRWPISFYVNDRT